MPTGQGPTTVRRRLRAELRSLRTAKGMTVEEVTNEVEWSISKLIRIENGQVGVSVSDLAALLQVYGVRDKARVDELKELARATRQRTWWSRYQKYLPQPYLEFIGAESDATRVRHYHPTMVPGLLQTLDYAAAIMAATGVTRLPADVEKARIEVRMLRQRDVLGREQPPEFTVILDEPVLRRPVGGPATMQQQLDHLVDLASREKVNVVVLPFSVGPHPGLLGAFALMEYDDPLNDDVVGLETASGNLILRDLPDVTAEYRAVAEHLVEMGLTGEDAIAFIRQVRKSYD
ncbi:helix-turn-helix domain-containing protein [Phytohabitans rumicis]|uniref:Transcriptional regulator n=1 Tax=Phytohabitans rumicis TaxID=1076125 RepID=A0A6V8LIV4_9ACTN|nr:helix-turn-helix transcriptional regulator [Phytohabitans rumicis]GFJ94579.1 transcriptional regulator [Phytohabitans rumicis]